MQEDYIKNDIDNAYKSYDDAKVLLKESNMTYNSFKDEYLLAKMKLKVGRRAFEKGVEVKTERFSNYCFP